jgi:hypothetical protein
VSKTRLSNHPSESQPSKGKYLTAPSDPQGSLSTPRSGYLAGFPCPKRNIPNPQVLGRPLVYGTIEILYCTTGIALPVYLFLSVTGDIKGKVQQHVQGTCTRCARTLGRAGVMSPQSQYKPLLPAPEAGGGPGGQDPDKRAAAKRRRANRPNACENCRVKKARCDGKRPSCSKCETWGTVCVYSVDHVANVERQLKDHRDILELLLSLPEDEALAAHRQLRSTSNLADALSSLQGSMHGRHRPSSIRTAQAISPPTSSSLEFELTVRHPIAYPTLFPLDIPSLSADPRLRPVQRSQGLLEGSSPSDTMSPSTSSSNDQSGATPSDRPSIKQEEDIGPHRDKYCDERLHQLQIGYWTGVSIEDEVAASAISHYLKGNHAIFGFFDPDLFIQDLIAHQHNYCSSFLVNALMAHACVSTSPIATTLATS